MFKFLTLKAQNNYFQIANFMFHYHVQVVTGKYDWGVSVDECSSQYQ